MKQGPRVYDREIQPKLNERPASLGAEEMRGKEPNNQHPTQRPNKAVPQVQNVYSAGHVLKRRKKFRQPV